MNTTEEERLPIVRLALLTAAALIIHGYHLGVEDAEIYIPAAKKLLNPSLYPYATEFFLSHERLSLFGQILAWTARLTRYARNSLAYAPDAHRPACSTTFRLMPMAATCH